MRATAMFIFMAAFLCIGAGSAMAAPLEPVLTNLSVKTRLLGWIHADSVSYGGSCGPECERYKAHFCEEDEGFVNFGEYFEAFFDFDYAGHFIYAEMWEDNALNPTVFENSRKYVTDTLLIWSYQSIDIEWTHGQEVAMLDTEDEYDEHTATYVYVYFVECE